MRGKGHIQLHDRTSFRLRSLRAQVGLLVLCLFTQAPLSLFVAQDACCADEEPATNLLENAGAENGTGEQPAVWRVFTVPAEGVEALWDKNAHHSGERSLMLRVETPYPDEVYNNWYQLVSPILAGKKLLLTGYIRGKEVTEAAIWMQCWRDNSGEVLRFATTSISHPVTGTVDWMRVETSIVPPADTAFLTVRCVLAGKGTAWFDDLSLVPEREPDKASPDKETNVKPSGTDPQTLKELLEAHKILLETNKSLAENTRLIMQELAKIREELSQLRQLVGSWPREEKTERAGKPPEPGPDPPFRPATGRREASPSSEL